MGGFGGAFQTPFGFWILDGALSQSFDHGPGAAARLGYDLSNIKSADGIKRSVRLQADYRTKAFAPVGMLEPDNGTVLDLSASYSQDLPWDLSGSLSGNYSLGRNDTPDRYSVDISLARNFGPSLTAGLSAGYAQSLGGTDETAYASDGFKAEIHLSYRLDQQSSIDALHDARSGRSQIGYRYQEGLASAAGTPSSNSTARRPDPGDPDHYGLGGSIGYIANRAELSLSQQNGLVGLDTKTIDQRTSVTAGTAIAFADGRVAVGRPISNGFAIVERIGISRTAMLPSARRKTPKNPRPISSAQRSSPTSPPYSPSRIAYDVSNLPPGYDLGAGGFDLSSRL